MRSIRLSAMMMVCSASILMTSMARPFQQEPAAAREELLMPEDFTKILKEEWTFLKDATDEFLQSSEKRNEFETSSEFEKRVGQQREALLGKIATHIKDGKFDTRVFSILVKANLNSYNADSQTYAVQCAGAIEAPYNTPEIRCFVPQNPYVGLADSVKRGYRFSSVYLKFKPEFRWRVGRDEARSAKTDEPNVYFKITLMLDLSQGEMKKQASLKILPKQVALINRRTQARLWESPPIR